jgi:uncharacterized membrane protein YadS
MTQSRSGMLTSEDWWSVWIGVGIFAASLAVFAGIDLLGWAVKTNEWLRAGDALTPVSKSYTGLSGPLSALFTYLLLLFILGVGAAFLKADLKKFALGFTAIFWVSFACWFLGHYAYIAATRDKLGKLGIGWSMNLTGEAGLIIALLAGLAVSNFFPGLTRRLAEATRPEWYIKTAIVIMGAGLGVKAAGATGLASAVIFCGLCAIVAAYLIYWALVYFIARKYFRFSREFAAPLASGVSICGVSAAIATGGAIRARPIVPVMVSSLVVVFAVVELILLPFLAQQYLYTQPMVAGAWMGLAVKTDGAAVASGAVVDSLVLAKALAVQGVKYEPGWLLMTASTVKIFIDVFIGVWAFVLAVVWCAKIDCKEGQHARLGDIWTRFPKFVLGYVLTFVFLLVVCLAEPSALASAKTATAELDVFRKLFFAMTFFAIGLVSDFRKLWEAGIGRLAAVYLVSLFGFIIWIGLAISWVFFHGMLPPVAAG